MRRLGFDQKRISEGIQGDGSGCKMDRDTRGEGENSHMKRVYEHDESNVIDLLWAQ